MIKIKLSEYLKENNISERKFAKMLGISNVYLNDLLKGKKEYISSNIAEKIKLISSEIDMEEIKIIKYKIV